MRVLTAGDCWPDQPSCAVEVLLESDGRPAPARAVDVELRTGSASRVVQAVPSARAEGAVKSGEVESGGQPGRFEAVVERGATLRVRVDGGPWVDAPWSPPAPPEALALGWLGPRQADVGETVDVRIAVPPGRAVSDLLAVTSEGRIRARTLLEGVLTLTIELAPDRSARVLGVGVVDLSEPGLRPLWGAVSLRARQTADVGIGEGNRAEVLLGGRKYGPFVAGASGQARVSFDVLPGETAAQLTATDDLGNRRTVQTPLPTRTSALVGLLAWPLPRGQGVVARVHAWDAVGRDDPRVPVSCSGPGGALELAALGAADWTATWRGEALGDVLIECAADLAAARAGVAVGAGWPERIELRVYPESLASDFPLASAQASLVDHRGQTVAPDGLSLTAERGALTTTVNDHALRADYRGEAAVASGGDRLTAAWRARPGSGGVWELQLAASLVGGDGLPVDLIGGVIPVGRIEAVARVLDRDGRPLAGVPVGCAVPGLSRSATSDAAGWAGLALDAPPAPLQVVRCTAGRLMREVPVYAGVRSPLPDPAAPDLAAAVELPIRAGAVRRIFLDVSPRPLPLDGHTSARVTVQLLDAAGNLIRGEDVRLSASLGELGPATPRPDGSLEAVLPPLTGTVARQVRITAVAGDTSVATDLELVPRTARGAVGVTAGWMSNFNSVSSPRFGLAVTTRIPQLPSVVEARVGVTGWGIARDVHDDNTGQTVAVRGQFLGLDVGPVVVERQGNRVLEGGVSLVAVPYALSVDYGAERGVFGVDIAPPGVLLHAAPGLRFGNAELTLEVDYLFDAGPRGAVTLSGGAGGLSLSAGYRLLF